MLILGLSSVISKADDNQAVSSMIFSQFEDGFVVMKSNKARVAAKLNYDKVAESVLYLENNARFILDIDAVTVVVIKERYFIPAENNFYYERITSGDNEFFIRHKAKVLSKGRAAGYGGYSETSSISGISSVSNSSNLNHVGVDEIFDCKDDSGLFIMNGRKHVRISTLKNLVSVFKPHKTALEVYAKEHKTDFANLDHVIAIVEYAFSL